MSYKMRLADLVMSSSWSVKRDRAKYDADWMLYIADMWRVTMGGIPSVFG